MVQNVNPTFVKTPNVGAVFISTGTNQSQNVTVYSGGINGSKINSVMASANTSASFNVSILFISSASQTFFLGTTLVPQSAGLASSVSAVNLLNTNSIPGLPIDSDGNPYIFLPSTSWLLAAQSNAQSSLWSGTNSIAIIAIAGDF